MSTLDRRLRELPIAPPLLALVVLGSVMAVGAVHIDVLLVVSAVGIAGTAFALWVGRREVPALPTPSWVLLGLAIWSALQAVPLPMRMLSAVAPRNADVWARAMRPFGEGAPPLASISLDPGASLVEALKWTTYAAVFALAHLAGKRHGRNWGPVIVFFSAVAVALVTLGHGLVGARMLFGIYAPVQAVPRWGLPPLLNPNNLSGYLNLGVFCGAGLILTHRASEPERPLPPDWVVASSIAAVVGVSVLAASRGGVLGLGAGAVVLAGLVRALRSGRNRRRTGGTSRRRLAALVAAIAGGGLLAALGASEATWEELRSAGAEKLRLIAWSRPLIADHPWFGVGRGAFETTFQAYQATGGRTLYTHPENFVVQWVAEWGLPATILGMALLAWSLRPKHLGLKENRAALGVLVGGAVLLFQNLADLALEVPAVMIALAAAAGSIHAGATQSEPGRSRAARWLRRAPAFVLAVTGLAAWAVVMARGRHPVGVEREEIHAVFAALSSPRPPSWQTIEERLRAAVRRHPGEPYFALIGAMAARRTEEHRAMSFIAAALERDPKSGEAHLVLSEILAKRGAKLQALMELRTAAELEPSLSELAGRRAVRLTRDWEELGVAVPEGTRGAPVFMGAADALTESGEWELLERALASAVERDGGLMRARVARAELTLKALERGAAPCAGAAASDCRARLTDEIGAIERVDNSACAAPMLSARILAAEGKHEAAAQLLAAKCPICRETAQCVQLRVGMVARTASPVEFKDAVRAMLGLTCGEPKACAYAHLIAAGLHAQRGEWGNAADQYALSLQKEESADVYLRLADAAVHGGDRARARTALRQAERLGRNDPALKQRVDSLENQPLLPAVAP